MSENEKDEEIKKTSETETFDGFDEGEGMENGEEGSGLEKVPVSDESLSLDICETGGNVSVPESEVSGEFSGDSYEDTKTDLLREKWLTVTGKRPRNIPRIQKYFDVFTAKFVFFGDRKPADVEKRNRQRLLTTSRKINALGINYGKILQEIRLPALFSSLMCLRFHPSGEYLTTSYRRGRIQIIKIETGEQIASFSTMESEQKSILRAIRFFPNDPEKLYLAGEAGIVHVINPNTGQFLGASEAKLNVVNNMEFNADCSFLAVAGIKGRVTVLDPHTLQVISDRSWPEMGETITPEVEEEYHRLRVYGIKFHPENVNLFATAGWDNTIKIWDVRTTPAIRCMKCPMINGDGLDITGNKILTVSWQMENSVNLWDFYSGTRIKTIPLKVKSTKFDGEFLYIAKFINSYPDERVNKSNLVVLAGSGFTDVIILNIDSESVVQYFHALKPIRVLDVLGSLITYGGKESILRVGKFNFKGIRNT